MPSSQDIVPTPPAAASEARLSFAVKITYGIGEIANAIKVVTFGIYSLFFATSVLHLPGTWIGVIGFLAMFWDAVIDPYIGYRTDGPHAHARRYRFMFAGALVMGAGYWAFFSPPKGLSMVALFVWLLMASFIVRTATSLYSVPYAAVGVSLSNDYHERTSISGIRSMAGLLGTLLTASLSFIVFFPEKVPGVDPKLDVAGYSSMGLVFGLAMTAVALIAAFGTSGLKPVESATDTGAAEPQGSFFVDTRQAISQPSFRMLVFSFSLVVMGLAVNSSLLLHFLKYYVEINRSADLSASQATFYISSLAGMLIWIRLSKYFEKRTLYIFSAAVTSVLMLGAQWLFGAGHPLGTGDARAWIICYGFAGFFSCILWFIPHSMIADVADENELLTGKRSTGTLFGIFSFSQQAATGVAILLAGFLLDRYVGLETQAPQQSALTVSRLATAYSVTPAAFFFGAAILMRRYGLTRERVAVIQADLLRARPAGAMALEPISTRRTR